MAIACSVVAGKVPGTSPSLLSGGISPSGAKAMMLPVTRASPRAVKGFEASFQSRSCADDGVRLFQDWIKTGARVDRATPLLRMLLDPRPRPTPGAISNTGVRTPGRARRDATLGVETGAAPLKRFRSRHRDRGLHAPHAP